MGGFIKKDRDTGRWISMSDEGAREKVGVRVATVLLVVSTIFKVRPSFFFRPSYTLNTLLVPLFSVALSPGHECLATRREKESCQGG